jgi:pyridoxamine 5'-phosphate oxidase
VKEVRLEYRWGELRQEDLDPDPFEQLRRWFTAADEAEVAEPTAMQLATADAEGRPSARTVLLRGFDHRGFRFYTNRRSRKGRQLAANPYCALVFRWAPFERQITVTGRAEPLSDEESDTYFAARPRGSQLGAWASEQSEVIRDRDVLEGRLAELEAQYPDHVPRPPHWGGYLVVPDGIELWQGRESRLHDRFRYRRDGDAWTLERLAP